VVALERRGGALVRADIGLAGAAGTARRASAAEVALLGTAGASDDLARAAAAAARDDADPVDEPQTGPAYRRRLVEVLLRRTLEDAVARGGGA
jgi:CO/xanthine dehydrogenase FAD-binding subunit